MLALAENWPEAAVAVAASVLQGWLAWLAWKQSRENGRALKDSTVLTRSTDTTPTSQADALLRREDDPHDEVHPG